MDIEFTRLADVPAVEEVQDNDTVLIVRDGDVKQAPKTSVGGSGGWDMIIHLDGNEGAMDDSSLYSIESGSYADLKAKWDQGELPNIMLTYMHNYGPDFYNRVKIDRIVHWTEDSVGHFDFFAVLANYNNLSSDAWHLQISQENVVENCHIQYLG